MKIANRMTVIVTTFSFFLVACGSESTGTNTTTPVNSVPPVTQPTTNPPTQPPVSTPTQPPVITPTQPPVITPTQPPQSQADFPNLLFNGSDVQSVTSLWRCEGLINTDPDSFLL